MPFTVGQKVQCRDSDKEQWKNGTVMEVLASGKPKVQLEGQSRAFTWEQVQEVGGSGGGGGGGGSTKISVGDRVRVRDSDREQWKEGEVMEMVGDKPKVKLQGQSRAFTWNHWESIGGGGAASGGTGGAAPASSGKISVGDKVRVRDSDREQWKEGTVMEMLGDKPKVKLEGQSRAFTWAQVEKVGGGGGGGAAAPAPAPAAAAAGGKFSVGDKVKVRDSDKEAWRNGKVTEIRGDKPVVQVDGASRGFTWTFVERQDGAAAPSSGGGGGAIGVGDKCRVRDSDKEQWKEGTVMEMVGDKPKVKLEGQSRAFTWNFFEKIGGGATGGAEKKAEPQKWKPGDRCQVRDSDREAFRKGTVTEMRGDKPVVKVDGANRGFTWEQVIPLDGAGGSAPAPASGGSGKIDVGAKVRVRDSDKEQWKEGTVMEMVGDKPKVKLEGQTRAFTWNFVEPVGGAAPAPASGGGGSFKVGDRVRCRDKDSEPWRNGKVTELRGDKPVVQVDGASRGFTWASVEKLEDSAPKEDKKPGGFAVGDKVRVRDSDKEQWKEGTVMEMVGDKPKVKLDGQSRPFTWNFVEPVGGASATKPAEPAKTGSFAVGDKVKVRDNEREAWRMGVVTELRGDKPVVKCDGASRGFTWNFCEAAGDPAPPPKPAASSGGAPQVGDRVRCRDKDSEPWRTGKVTEIRGDKPVVQVDGATRGFTWNHVEKLDDSGDKKDEQKKEEPKKSGAVGVGDRVRCKDRESEQWRAGVVTEMRGDKPVVKVDGASRGFTWAFVEPADGGSAPAPASTAPSPTPPAEKKPDATSGGKWSVGDRVKVRDSDREQWKEGTVTEMAGDRPKVKLDGQNRAFTWNQVEPSGGSGGPSPPPSKEDGKPAATPAPAPAASSSAAPAPAPAPAASAAAGATRTTDSPFSVGMRVRVRTRIQFCGNRTVEPGMMGTVQKVPGDPKPGQPADWSPAQVSVDTPYGPILFSAEPGELEPAPQQYAATPWGAPAAPGYYPGAAMPGYAAPFPGSPQAGSFMGQMGLGVPQSAPIVGAGAYGSFGGGPMFSDSPAGTWSRGGPGHGSWRQNYGGGRRGLSPTGRRGGGGRGRRDRSPDPGERLWDEPMQHPPFCWRGPNPRQVLNWPQLLLIDPSFPHGVDPDTVRRLVENIGDSCLAPEDASRLEPGHVQRLHQLSQVCLQYLAYQNNCLLDEQEDVRCEAEALLKEKDKELDKMKDRLAKLEDELSHIRPRYKEAKRALQDERALRQQAALQQMAQVQQQQLFAAAQPRALAPAPQLLGAAMQSAGGGVSCPECGQWYRKPEHLASHRRKRRCGLGRFVTGDAIGP